MQPLAADELHHVVGQAVLLADAEDRDDVRVVEPRGRVGFADEALAALRVQLRVRGQYLEGDRTAERLLHRLEHDAHPAAADLADDAEVAKAVRERFLLGRASRAAELLEDFHLRDGREQFAELLGVVGVSGRVVADGGVLAAAQAVRELLGQHVHWVAIIGGGHALSSAANPGSVSRICFNRASART